MSQPKTVHRPSAGANDVGSAKHANADAGLNQGTQGEPTPAKLAAAQPNYSATQQSPYAAAPQNIEKESVQDSGVAVNNAPSTLRP